MKSEINIFTDNQNNIQNVDIIFGGRIGTTFAKRNEIGAVIFHQLDKLKEIGESNGDMPIDDCKNHFNVKLIFDNIKSVEVVEKALHDVKEHLSQFKK